MATALKLDYKQKAAQAKRKPWQSKKEKLEPM